MLFLVLFLFFNLCFFLSLFLLFIFCCLQPKIQVEFDRLLRRQQQLDGNSCHKYRTANGNSGRSSISSDLSSSAAELSSPLEKVCLCVCFFSFDFDFDRFSPFPSLPLNTVWYQKQFFSGFSFRKTAWEIILLFDFPCGFFSFDYHFVFYILCLVFSPAQILEQTKSEIMKKSIFFVEKNRYRSVSTGFKKVLQRFSPNSWAFSPPPLTPSYM